MLNELEMIVINKDIPEYGLIKGDIGVIVYIYENGLAVEVEFVSGKRHTVEIVTLTKDDVRQIANDEIFHVRELHSA